MNRSFISCLVAFLLSFAVSVAAEGEAPSAEKLVDADGRTVVVTSEVPLPSAENAGIKFVAPPVASELGEPRVFGVPANEFSFLLSIIHEAGRSDPEVEEIGRQIQALELRRMILGARRALGRPSDRAPDLKRILGELEAREKALKPQGENAAK